MKVIALLIVSLFCSASHATSCWLKFAESEMSRNSGIDALQLVLNNASHIFIAEAITTVKTVYSTKGEESSIMDFSTVFEVSRFIKGKGAKNVTVKRGSECGCSYDYVPGVKYVVIAREQKGILYASGCGYVETANETWIEVVEEAING